MLESMKALGNKTTSSPTAKDAKKVLKSLVTDTTFDAETDKIFQLSSALFAISSNYLISTALVHHPKQFSALNHHSSIIHRHHQMDKVLFKQVMNTRKESANQINLQLVKSHRFSHHQPKRQRRVKKTKTPKK